MNSKIFQNYWLAWTLFGYSKIEFRVGDALYKFFFICRSFYNLIQNPNFFNLYY